MIKKDIRSGLVALVSYQSQPNTFSLHPNSICSTNDELTEFITPSQQGQQQHQTKKNKKTKKKQKKKNQRKRC